MSRSCIPVPYQHTSLPRGQSLSYPWQSHFHSDLSIPGPPTPMFCRFSPPSHMPFPCTVLPRCPGFRLMPDDRILSRTEHIQTAFLSDCTPVFHSWGLQFPEMEHRLSSHRSVRRLLDAPVRPFRYRHTARPGVS